MYKRPLSTATRRIRRIHTPTLIRQQEQTETFREPVQPPSFGLRSSEPVPPKAPIGTEALVFSEFLANLFHPLSFPPDLARRTLTHASHKLAPIHGHGGRFSFIGRRVSQAYLTMFLQTHHTSHSPADFASILSTTLSDTSLGAYVAPSWQLNRVLLWNPPLDRYVADKLNERVARGEELDEESQKEAYSVFKQAGMHKIMGDAVQAVFGGVFHQFGGQVAHQIFHTRILPHLDLPKTGLPEPFKTRQRDIRNKWAHTTTNKLELEAIEPEESRIES